MEVAYSLLGLFIASIILFSCFVALSIVKYQEREGKSYLMRNHFPYELNENGAFSKNIAANLCLIISLLAFAVCYILALFYRYDNYFILIFVTGILSLFVPIALVFTPLSNGKIHLIFVTISFLLVLLSNAFIGIEAIRIFNLSTKTIALISAIFAFIFAFVTFILAINPKLSKWAQLDVSKNDDGTVTYVRPNIFPLAYSEWAVIILDYCTLLPLFLLMLSLK